MLSWPYVGSSDIFCFPRCKQAFNFLLGSLCSPTNVEQRNQNCHHDKWNEYRHKPHCITLSCDISYEVCTTATGIFVFSIPSFFLQLSTMFVVVVAFFLGIPMFTVARIFTTVFSKSFSFLQRIRVLLLFRKIRSASFNVIVFGGNFIRLRATYQITVSATRLVLVEVTRVATGGLRPCRSQWNGSQLTSNYHKDNSIKKQSFVPSAICY